VAKHTARNDHQHRPFAIHITSPKFANYQVYTLHRAFAHVSIYDKHGQYESRTVLDLAPGTVVTVPLTKVMYVAKKCGIFCQKGLTVQERVKARISFAHPNFLEKLERES